MLLDFYYDYYYDFVLLVVTKPKEEVSVLIMS